MRVGVVLQAMLQLRVALPVEEEDVHPLRPRAIVDDLVEHAAVLALEVDVGRDAALGRRAAR